MFEFTQDTGPFRVGLKLVRQGDPPSLLGAPGPDAQAAGRTTSARPQQTLIWYPATAASGAPMAVGDYLELWRGDLSGSGDPDPRIEQWRAGMQASLAQPCRAIVGAEPAPGSYPLVIYAPSMSAPAWENADLCEYLASHGYVVMAASSLGLSGGPMTHDVAGIDAQAADISFLIDFAESWPQANRRCCAVIGFSWGGLANVAAAARDARISALVSLDGSLRFSPGLVARMRDVDPSRLDRPLLSIMQGLFAPEELDAIQSEFPGDAGPSILNAWTLGDLISVEMFALNHMAHASMFQRNEQTWRAVEALDAGLKAGFGRADAAASFGLLALYVLRFLDHYLKGIEDALTIFVPGPDDDVPCRLSHVRYRKGARPAAPCSVAR